MLLRALSYDIRDIQSVIFLKEQMQESGNLSFVSGCATWKSLISIGLKLFFRISDNLIVLAQWKKEADNKEMDLQLGNWPSGWGIKGIKVILKKSRVPVYLGCCSIIHSYQTVLFKAPEGRLYLNRAFEHLIILVIWGETY